MKKCDIYSIKKRNITSTSCRLYHIIILMYKNVQLIRTFMSSGKTLKLHSSLHLIRAISCTSQNRFEKEAKAEKTHRPRSDL